MKLETDQQNKLKKGRKGNNQRNKIETNTIEKINKAQ